MTQSITFAEALESGKRFCKRQHTTDVLLCMQERALAKKANKIEKLKNKKGGHAMWGEVHELGQLIR